MTMDIISERKITVLLIEDDLDDVLFIRNFLKTRRQDVPKFDLVDFNRLRQGVEYLENGGPADVILLDLSLPDGHGLKTISQVLLASPQVPIIVLTDLNDEGTAIKALREGVHDYLIKGKVDSDLLIRAICYAIERYRLMTNLRQIDRLTLEVNEQKRMGELKDEFVSAVSHELRTPLTIIQNAVSNLKDEIGGPLTEDQQAILEVTTRNCERLAKLINDLLDLSRLESGKTQLYRRRLEPGPFFQEVVNNFSTLAQEAGVQLVLETMPKLPAIYVDIDMLVQVMNNLLNNALRFAKQRIVLRIAERKDTLSPLSDGPEEVARFLQISVVDDGIGISEKDIGLIFNKFAQINRPVGGSGYKGTGLGLVICKDIIELHQGKIWVESKPAEGARFHFILPTEAAYSAVSLNVGAKDARIAH